jgi:sulfur transfer complex TusBCD TusB component (DsrH family)
VVLVADLSREGWVGLLAEARRTATLLFVDLTHQQPAVVQQVVAALTAVLAETDGVLVAVEADHFHQYIQLKPEWANVFSPLYL